MAARQDQSPSFPKLMVIIVQHGHWDDTARCVTSVLAGSRVPDWVVIVDNASPDKSAKAFLAWARGAVAVPLPDFASTAPVPMPLPLVELPESSLDSVSTPHTPCVFVSLSRNGGYAAGNNVGLRLGLRWGADAFLILNNDTMVEPQAIQAMLERLSRCSRPGLCGALLRYCHEEQSTQCLAGGHTDPRTALSHITGQGLTVEEARRVPLDVVEAEINYICGACVMASRNFVETVGLLDEGYFLYCEEQDWAWRAAGRFDLAYAPDALVWHREGTSTGWNGRGLALRPLLRLTISRLRCTWRHHPQWLPTVLLATMFSGGRLVIKILSKSINGLRQQRRESLDHA